MKKIILGTIIFLTPMIAFGYNQTDFSTTVEAEFIAIDPYNVGTIISPVPDTIYFYVVADQVGELSFEAYSDTYYTGQYKCGDVPIGSSWVACDVLNTEGDTFSQVVGELGSTYTGWEVGIWDTEGITGYSGVGFFGGSTIDDGTTELIGTSCRTSDGVGGWIYGCNGIQTLAMAFDDPNIAETPTGLYFFSPTSEAKENTNNTLATAVKTNMDSGVIQTTLLAISVFLAFYILQKVMMFFGYAYSRRDKKKLLKNSTMKKPIE